MPYKNKADRNYRKEYDTYQGTPIQKKRRATRNAARALMAKGGAISSSLDVDHKIPLSKGGTNNKKNLRAVPKKKNRSFKRTSTGAVKK